MYSKDYRKRAVEYRKEGHSFDELREVFKIHPPTYYRWEKEYESGYEQPQAPRERTRKIDKEALKRAVEERPDAYLRELAELFDCTAVAVYYALKKMGLTLKKRHLHTPKNQKSNGRRI
jgi:transposase